MHVITRFIRGGADENTALTCNGQARLGHDVTLIYGREHHRDMLARLDPAVRVIEEPSLVREVAPNADLRCVLALRRRFRDLDPDVIHTHESKAGVVGRLAARLAGGRAAIVHGVHILAHLSARGPKAALYWSMDWIAARWTDLFINVSDGMRDACLRAGLGRPDDHVVVESGMDIETFSGAPALTAEARACLRGLAPGAPVLVLIAGALEARKRAALLIDVFAELPASCDQACLVIAGDGPERAEIEARIKAHGLETRAVCIGHRDDLAAWIAAADLCVHVSENEGLPRVVVQYVIAGKPVVACALPGLERVVADGVNGLIVRPDDRAGLVDALARLITDPDRRAAMSAASRMVDVASWSVHRMVERTEAAYRRVLESAST